MKYKIKPYDEVHDVHLLYRHNFWFFWTFVSAGSRQRLEEFVESKGGTLVN